VESMVSFERVFEVLDLPLEIVETPLARDMDEVTGLIQFENVSFSYQDSGTDKVGLDDIARISWRDQTHAGDDQDRGQ